MAVRFAIATGNWSNTAIWDNGALPQSGDDVFTNGTTVTIDQDINIGSLRNSLSIVTLPNMSIPAMTGNTQPSGTAFAGQNSSTAWYAFDQTVSNVVTGNVPSTLWSSSNLTNCTLGYQFTSGKIIKRYSMYKGGGNNNPTAWTFEGSNDGTTYTILETVTGNATTNYISTILSNTTSYTYYRVNITAITAGIIASVGALEMTESVGTVFGNVTGGNFSITSSRTIIQSGLGIISNNSSNVISITATTGNIVNFNISGSGQLFHTFWWATNTTVYGVYVNGTCTVNFNGDILANTQSTASNGGGNIGINAGATINIIGNIYGSLGNPTSPVINLLSSTSNSSVVNITGNIIGAGSNSATVIINNSTSTVNITGTLTSGLAQCYSCTTAGNLNVTGTVTVTNLNSAPAINSSGTGVVTLNSPIINVSNVNAVFASRVRFYSTAQVQWLFQNSAGTNTILYSAGASLGLPLTTNVRYPVQYGANNELTGQVIIPLPSNVRVGVPTDNTIGTGELTADDFLNAIAISTNPVAERLRTTSTVDTTGNQMAAYNV